MHAEVDISLLTATSAVGRIHGSLEFTFLPRVGEVVSLLEVADLEAGFNGHVVVEHVIRPANSTDAPMLSLSDIVATSEAAAKSLGAAFEAKYDLFFDPYDE